MSDFAVRAVTPEDREHWCALYAGYRAFYRLEPDDDSGAETAAKAFP